MGTCRKQTMAGKNDTIRHAFRLPIEGLYVHLNEGEPEGPLSLNQLIAMLSRGRIDYTTLVWHDRLESWQGIFNFIFPEIPEMSEAEENQEHENLKIELESLDAQITQLQHLRDQTYDRLIQIDLQRERQENRIMHREQQVKTNQLSAERNKVKNLIETIAEDRSIIRNIKNQHETQLDIIEQQLADLENLSHEVLNFRKQADAQSEIWEQQESDLKNYHRSEVDELLLRIENADKLRHNEMKDINHEIIRLEKHLKSQTKHYDSMVRFMTASHAEDMFDNFMEENSDQIFANIGEGASAYVLKKHDHES